MTCSIATWATRAAGRRTSIRAAFTLTELLVVMGIIAIVVAITLPAVESARESSRRVQCQDRLRQIGIGFANFTSAHRNYPTNGGPADDNRLRATDGGWVVPSTTDFVVGGTSYFGVGSDKRSTEDQTGPWCYALFPFLELDTLSTEGVFRDSLAGFRCASRDRRPSRPTVTDVYGAYESGGHAMAKTDFASNAVAMPQRGSAFSPAQLTDGSSQTILVGEKSFNSAVQTETSWYYDEPIWIGGSLGTSRTGARILTDQSRVPDDDSPRFQDNWGSPHVAGAFFLFADGHVTFLSTSTNTVAIRAALTPDNGDQFSETP